MAERLRECDSSILSPQARYPLPDRAWVTQTPAREPSNPCLDRSTRAWNSKPMPLSDNR